MKKSAKFMSFVMAAAILVLSCSKTDTAPTQASLLIGTWTAVSYVRTGCTDATMNEALNYCTTACETFTFTATTLTISSPGSAPQVMPITISGSTITSSSNPETVTFVVAGTSLTLTIKSLPTGNAANCNATYVFKKA